MKKSGAFGIEKLNGTFKPRSHVGVKLEDGTRATCEHDALPRLVRYFQKLFSATVKRDPAVSLEIPDTKNILQAYRA